MTLQEEIGLQIKKLRKDKHITGEALADRIGLSRSSIVNIEKGRQRLKLKNLYKIASALGVGIHKILPPAAYEYSVAPLANMKKLGALKREAERLQLQIEKLEA